MSPRTYEDETGRFYAVAGKEEEYHFSAYLFHIYGKKLSERRSKMLALLQAFMVKSKGCKYAPAYAPLSVSVNSFSCG